MDDRVALIKEQGFIPTIAAIAEQRGLDVTIVTPPVPPRKEGE